MNILNKLERKFGKYGIKNLMLYIVIANAITFVFGLFNPFLYNSLALVPNLVIEGQFWRVFTFLFIPPNTNIIFILLSLYFYYWIGSTLEVAWGTFKFNLYYFIGVLSVIAGSFITGLATTNVSLNLSLFLVFAHLFPNQEVFLYFLIGIKLKYLAFLYWILIAWSVIASDSINSVIIILLPLLNYFIFFGKDIVKGIIRKFNNRNSKNNIKVAVEKFSVKDNLPQNYTIHKCTVCGITEKDDKNMEFRFCSKCNGFHEYCINHLSNHEHIREDSNK